MTALFNSDRNLTSSRNGAQRLKFAPLDGLLRLARHLGRLTHPAGTADLASASFLRQEPNLAKEAGFSPRGLSPMATLTLSVME